MSFYSIAIYEAGWNSDEKKPSISNEYIEHLCRDVFEELRTIIEQQIKELHHADETGKADTVAMEIEAHLKFAEGRPGILAGWLIPPLVAMIAMPKIMEEEYEEDVARIRRWSSAQKSFFLSDQDST